MGLHWVKSGIISRQIECIIIPPQTADSAVFDSPVAIYIGTLEFCNLRVRQSVYEFNIPSFSGPSLFRDGIYQRRRSNVPNPTSWEIQGNSGMFLRC